MASQVFQPYRERPADQVRERLEELTQFAVSAGLRKTWEYCKHHPLQIVAGVVSTGFLLRAFLRGTRKNCG